MVAKLTERRLMSILFSDKSNELQQMKSEIVNMREKLDTLRETEDEGLF